MQHEDLLKLIATVAVCVVPFKDVPDLSQTYPIKVLEYLSLGKPIVASNILGISQLIAHGHNGLLFRASDAEDLARNLCDIFLDASLNQRLAENAKNLDCKYDANVKGEQIVALLEQIVAN